MSIVDEKNVVYHGLPLIFSAFLNISLSFVELLDSVVFRDLGQHIRDQLKIAFAKGEATTQPNPEQCNRYYSSLKRISSNYYGHLYKRSLLSTASGLNKEQCNLALTPEMLEYLKEEDKGIFDHFFGRIKNIVKNDKD